MLFFHSFFFNDNAFQINLCVIHVMYSFVIELFEFCSIDTIMVHCTLYYMYWQIYLELKWQLSHSPSISLFFLFLLPHFLLVPLFPIYYPSFLYYPSFIYYSFSIAPFPSITPFPSISPFPYQLPISPLLPLFHLLPPFPSITHVPSISPFPYLLHCFPHLLFLLLSVMNV